jgi:hypothetical protein
MIDNINNGDKKIDVDNDVNKKKIRRNKKELFEKEREKIILKLNEIIKLEEKNNTVIYDDLVENIELKQYLIDNVELIKKYYSCSGWGYFTTHLHGNIPKDEVTLMKAIYKSENYKIASRSKSMIRGDIKKQCSELHFIKSK